MAERVPAKGKKVGGKVAGKELSAYPTKARMAAGGEGDRVGALEAECEQLKAKLAEAQSRIAMLEGQRELIANRIDWIIDSLHTLTED
jgi:hypothetical protein